MVSENKESNGVLEDADFSLDLDNIELPEIPDLDINEEENLKLEESDENFNKEDSLGEGDIEIEEHKLKQEEIEENAEDGITLNTKELDDILELESIEEGGLNQENIQNVNNIEDLVSEENSEEKIKVEPIEIDIADDLPIKEIEMEESDSEQERVESFNDESISLSEKELDDILGEEVLEPTLSEEKGDILKIQDSDLVKQIIPETEEIETIETKEIVEETSEDAIDNEEITLPPLSEVEMEEETISLSPEELEGIISNEDIQVITDEISSEEEESSLQQPELENIEIPEPVFEEDETISLTEDELHNIIDDVSQDLTIPEPEIYPVSEQIADREKLTDDLEKETGIKKEELKTIISYLDSLFDKLPEDAIREFSKSEYFNLYKKVIETLEIYPKE